MAPNANDKEQFVYHFSNVNWQQTSFPSTDVAHTTDNTAFLLSTVEYVAVVGGRYFAHMNDDSFVEIAQPTFTKWANEVETSFATTTMTCVNLVCNDLCDLDSDASVTIVMSVNAVVAVCKMQRTIKDRQVDNSVQRLWLFELYTAAGFTVQVESTNLALEDFFIPPFEKRVGKFLVWNYEPQDRYFRNELWVITIAKGTLQAIYEVDRQDMCFVDVYFKNGQHYVSDVLVDNNTVNLNALFLN